MTGAELPELAPWVNIEGLGQLASWSEIQYRKDIGEEGVILAEALARWVRRTASIGEPPYLGIDEGETGDAINTYLGYDGIERVIHLVNEIDEMLQQRGARPEAIAEWTASRPEVFSVRKHPEWFTEHRTLPYHD